MSNIKKTPENRERLIEYRRKGYSYEKARKLIPMGKKTLQDWRKEDESLQEELDMAYAQYFAALEDTVNEGARDDPNLALKILERRSPEDWSQTERVEHSIILEMPGLLEAKGVKASAWLKGAKDEDWKALDERAREGKLLEADYDLLEDPSDSDDTDSE